MYRFGYTIRDELELAVRGAVVDLENNGYTNVIKCTRTDTRNNDK